MKPRRDEVKKSEQLAMANGESELDILKIDQENLNEELMDQPTRFGTWAMKSAMKRAKMEKLKAAVGITEAKVSLELRARAVESGERVTEDGLKAKVKQDPEWLAAEYAYEAAASSYYSADAIKEALIQRHSMLITLAANLRAEMDNSLTINKR